MPRQSDEGEQDGDDGLLVHVRFLFVVTLYYIYDVFAEILRSGHSFHAVTFSESHSEPQRYIKSHEKAPDKTENRMPGVKLFTQVKSFSKICG